MAIRVNLKLIFLRSAVLQIALMKLIGTPEECQRLNNSRLALDVNTNTVQQEMPLFFNEGKMNLNALSPRAKAEFDALLIPSQKETINGND